MKRKMVRIRLTVSDSGTGFHHRNAVDLSKEIGGHLFPTTNGRFERSVFVPGLDPETGNNGWLV